ncbi:MAG: chemotaxis protein CheW, partial [Calditrichia bacterium]
MNQDRQTENRKDRISLVEIQNLWLGIDILKSKEIVPLPEVTPVPNTRDYVLGVFNLRGEIYSLVDISPILGLEKKTIQPEDMVILLKARDMTIGILADRIHGVRNIENAKIKHTHGSVSKKMEPFISGIISEKAETIYLLDVDHLFSSHLI